MGHTEKPSRTVDHAEVSKHPQSSEAGGDRLCGAALVHVSVLTPRARIPGIETSCLKVSVASMRLVLSPWQQLHSTLRCTQSARWHLLSGPSAADLGPAGRLRLTVPLCG